MSSLTDIVLMTDVEGSGGKRQNSDKTRSSGDVVESKRQHSRQDSNVSEDGASESSRHTYKYAYTQGLNFVALSFLRVVGLSPEEEESAFWMVVALVMDIAPGNV